MWQNILLVVIKKGLTYENNCQKFFFVEFNVMIWQNILLVPYKKGLTYEMLLLNTDCYKCTPLVGQLHRGYFKKKGL